MIVRQARIEDLAAVSDLAARLVKRGSFAHTTIDYRVGINRMIKAVMHSQEWLGVAEHNGKFVGFLLLVLTKYWWSMNEVYALDDGIYSERAGAGAALIRAGVKWAREQGAKEVILAINGLIDTEKAAHVIASCGFELRGVCMSMYLQNKAAQKGVAKWAA